jgi:hypothetical protein
VADGTPRSPRPARGLTRPPARRRAAARDGRPQRRRGGREGHAKPAALQGVRRCRGCGAVGVWRAGGGRAAEMGGVARGSRGAGVCVARRGWAAAGWAAWRGGVRAVGVAWGAALRGAALPGVCGASRGGARRRGCRGRSPRTRRPRERVRADGGARRAVPEWATRSKGNGGGREWCSRRSPERPSRGVIGRNGLVIRSGPVPAAGHPVAGVKRRIGAVGSRLTRKHATMDS